VSAFSVTILDLSRTALRLRRYAAGSRFGSGAFGMSILGIMGEKGVKGVEGTLPLAVPPEARFMERELTLMGDLRFSWSDWKLEVECESPVTFFAFGGLGFFEKSPIVYLKSRL
jgi:hypothetical protein